MVPLQLFLDANTFLGFYSLTPEDIEELKKLIELVRLKRLKLLLPDQLTDEVRRNRSKVVSDRLKTLKEARLQVSIPPLAEKTLTAEALRKSAAETHRAHSTLIDELVKAAERSDLPADKLIRDLFAAGTTLKDPTAYDAATRRKALGNPPGKGSSLGDAVNWEMLLKHAAVSENLYIITSDPDFASPLDPARFNEYLASEWADAKSAEIRFYRDIKRFFNDVLPEVHIAADVRKHVLIDSLVGSITFESTHDIVAELEPYESFSLEEATRLLTGGLDNTQVRWLARDDDVGALLQRVINPHRAALPKELVAKWDFLLAGHGHPYGPIPTNEDLAEAGLENG